MVSIGDRVKTLREQKGISQRVLAVNARVTPATISRLESGKIVDLKASALTGLADALGVSIDFLVGRVRELTPGDVINFDPAVQAIVQGYLNLGPEARLQLGEYTVYLEFKKNETLADRDHVMDRRHAPDAIISLGKIEAQEKPEG
jgi:transcriptional regulator with XRE-family HTH domain